VGVSAPDREIAVSRDIADIGKAEAYSGFTRMSADRKISKTYR